MQIMPWVEAIEARLVNGLPNTPIYLEGVPENDSIPRMDNGMIQPFVQLWFGQTTNGPLGSDSMVGVRASARRGLFLCQLVAPTGRSLLQLEDGVRDLLQGFSPNGEGELSEDSAPSIRDPLPEGTGVDTRFYKPLAYSGLVNSTTDCPPRVPDGMI
jgi:hypothetical protein